MKRLPFKDEFVNYGFAEFDEGYISASVASVVLGKIVIRFQRGLTRTNMFPKRFTLGIRGRLAAKKL